MNSPSDSFNLTSLVPDPGIYTIQQMSNSRFVDAHEIAEKDFAIVTRIAQNNDSQRWLFEHISGDAYTIRQVSSGRFADAHEIESKDFALVTRPQQNDDTQRWIVKPSGESTFTIQQKSNNRFVDAHEIESKDFLVVTRPEQNDNTQRWIIKSASPPPDLLAYSFLIQKSGSTCSIAGVVRNIGQTTARGPFKIATGVTLKDVYREVKTIVPVAFAIPPQSEFQTNAVTGVPVLYRNDDASNIYRLEMLVDYDFELFETTRSNNIVRLDHWFVR
jgi:Ricin-type beta-trefoil lectin domain-like